MKYILLFMMILGTSLVATAQDTENVEEQNCEAVFGGDSLVKDQETIKRQVNEEKRT